MDPFSRYRQALHETREDWRREYANKMRETARRQGRMQTFTTGGRRVGKMKAHQDEVDAARATGQEVWVARMIDGRSLVEKVPGIWLDYSHQERKLDEDIMAFARQMFKKPSPIIHIPKEVLESWQR